MLEINSTKVHVNVLISNIPKYKNYVTTTNAMKMVFLNMPCNSYIIYSMQNIIEWTPIKLCQSVYYLLKTNNEYWIIKNSKYEGLVYYYVILY